MSELSAKDYLKQIKKIDTQIANKAFEMQTLLSQGLIDMASIETQHIAALQSQKREIIAVIEQLPEAEYDVLHKVYVQDKTLQEVASDRNISYSLVTTIHGKALKMVEKLICVVMC